MNLLAIFKLGSLIIWIPGLLFLIAVLCALKAEDKGQPTSRLYQATLVLFVVSMLFAVLVPRSEMNKALEFARAYDPGTEIASFADIPYAARDAYSRMHMQEEGAIQPAGGGDIFDFSGAADDATDQAVSAASTEGIVYRPEREMGWFLLMVFLIGGAIFFIQGPKVLGRSPANSA